MKIPDKFRPRGPAQSNGRTVEEFLKDQAKYAIRFYKDKAKQFTKGSNVGDFLAKKRAKNA